MTKHEVTLQTDHYQILLGDANGAPYLDTTDLWSGSAQLAMLHGNRKLLGLATIRYGGRHDVTIIETDNHSALDPELFGEIRELGAFEMELPSRRLILWAPETEDLNSTPVIALSGEFYTGRAYCKDGHLVQDDNALDGPESYILVLTPTGPGLPPV